MNHQRRIRSLQPNRPTHLLKRKCGGESRLMQRDHQPFVQEDMGEKIRFPRSGLQEADDTEAPRPPLNRQASSVRGSAQSPCKIPEFARSDSRSFAMDAVRMQGSSRSLNSAF